MEQFDATRFWVECLYAGMTEAEADAALAKKVAEQPMRFKDSPEAEANNA